MKKNMKYFKLFFSILVAFFAAGFVGNTVFLSSTPKVNPNVFYAFDELGFQASYKLASVFHQKNKSKENMQLTASERLARLKEKAQNSPLDKIAKGVYAQSTDIGTIYTIKANELEWERHTYLIDGKNYVIFVEKGKRPPTAAEVRRDKVFYK